MTKLEQKYVQESERALAQFLERQRQERVASDILGTSFAQNEIRSDNEGEHDQDHADARAAAAAYAQARNSGARVRVYAQDNESQRAGVRSALDWLSRKKKSAIR